MTAKAAGALAPSAPRSHQKPAALSLAKRLGPRVRVVGADVNAGAIADAAANAAANGLGHVTFICGDLDDLAGAKLGQAIDSAAPAAAVAASQPAGARAASGRVGAVVVDPARAGLGARVVAFLRASRAPRLVYVSCNAATQARDAARLGAPPAAGAGEAAYRLVRVTPVDMFAHTAHVETVAVFEREAGGGA